MSTIEKKFRLGPITATIWAENKTVNNEMVKFYSVTIDKAYKKDEQWQHTNSCAAEDLPKVAILAEEAYKYIRLTCVEPNGQSE